MQQPTADLPPLMRQMADRPRPIEMRPVDPQSFMAAKPAAPVQNVWMRASQPIGEDLIFNQAVLAYQGVQTPVYVYTEREAELAALMPEKVAPDTSKYLLCPMPGLVKAINVAEGAQVQVGDALAVVEAMKMENILRAERDGVVAKLHAKPGDSLAVDQPILEFK